MLTAMHVSVTQFHGGGIKKMNLVSRLPVESYIAFMETYIIPQCLAIFLDWYIIITYGYLTWEWHAGIRGYSYPLLFAALYKILAVFNLDIPVLLVSDLNSDMIGG